MDDTAPREVIPTLKEAHAYFKTTSPMRFERVRSDSEFHDAIARQRAEGYYLIGVNDAGVPAGHYRAAFAKSALMAVS